jgi:hypothetical protein
LMDSAQKYVLNLTEDPCIERVTPFLPLFFFVLGF